ncbi:ankyrin repeat-containing protein NPR4-like [Corylus avellana]|uniref:ankyrin repeat-containing protein NPR4-like n=1 Tax=Corylus avellana TaxID=13451 RepID=UPI00286BA17B|nr:ankyrin repeat-containing protein NPR4-like [Corylus avellana]
MSNIRQRASGITGQDHNDQEEFDSAKSNTSPAEDIIDERMAREKRFYYLDTTVPLYQAALKGDWKTAKALFEKYPDVFSRPITEGNDTALHIAVVAEREVFVKEEVKCMVPKEIALSNNVGNTALHFAAGSGIVSIAKEMVEKTKGLPLIRGADEKIPLYVAALNGRRKMVMYLYPRTSFEELEPIERIDILIATIMNDMNDIALDILKNYRSLATMENSYERIALQELARKPFAIGSRSPSEKCAIKGIIAQYLDPNENNMLHLIGRLAPSDQLNIISGAALQMRRELLWFKEIEKIVPLSYKKMKNIDQGGTAAYTPWELFIKEHKQLKEQGEKWMKDTANYCMLVATLIATVVFAAAFTVPGGNNQEIGTPIFLKSNWFMVFFISDAMALLSSSTSILIFLSILTSRYAEGDFLTSLPARLFFGLTTLFISIASMVVAFSATCFLVYYSEVAWVPIVIITSAGVPVTLFVGLHFQLWADIIRSTYWSRFLFRPHKHRLF